MSKVFIFGSGFLVRHIANEFTSNGDEAIVMYNNYKLENYSGTQLMMKGSDIIDCLIKNITTIENNMFIGNQRQNSGYADTDNCDPVRATTADNASKETGED